MLNSPLHTLFNTFVALASPQRCIHQDLLEPHVRTANHIYMIAAGKAAFSMAKITGEILESLGCSYSGMAITRYGHTGQLALDHLETLEAAHPTPDSASLEAGEKALRLARACQAGDLLIVLLSGGASSLLCQPIEGVSLNEKQALTRALLTSGASIAEINTLRRRLSNIKGGGLFQAAQPAQVLTLAISDVPGNLPAIIGSGPTIPLAIDEPAPLDVINRYQLPVSETLKKQLLKPNKTLDPSIQSANHHFALVASPEQVFKQFCQQYQAPGRHVIFLGADLEGEARELGQEHMRWALEWTEKNNTEVLSELWVVSGGETSVTLSDLGKRLGRGGRNGEYLLGVLQTLEQSTHPLAKRAEALACDSDGIDGSEDNAGAIASYEQLGAAFDHCPTSLQQALDSNQSYSFFSERGALITTGPTLTNVNDFRIITIRFSDSLSQSVSSN